jgi:hypothetical protein
MKATDNTGVTFINTVLGRGHLSGVINIQLGVFNFSNDEKGDVTLDPSVACRLRMDYNCARQLKESIDSLLKDMENQAYPEVDTSVKITKLNGKSPLHSDSAN